MTGPARMQALDFRLNGHALIEASAGTGKTFTIAALYLRLVLGHGGDNAFSRALTPPEILVVTFTEAATQELRDRIRARLAQAAQAFAAEPGQPADSLDDFLRDLRDSHPPAQWPACAERLRIAADWMDEAAVSTIHGWCRRMLREHAFDSGSLFDLDLLADATELLDEAVRDYWRTFFHPLDADDAQAVVAWWSAPAALRKAIAPLVAHAGSLPDAPAPAEALQAARNQAAQSQDTWRAPWLDWCDELQDLLEQAVADKQVNGQKLKTNNFRGWLEQVRQWCRGERDGLGLTATAIARLSREGLREAWKRPEEAPDHPALAELSRLQARIESLPTGREDILAHAARWVSARLAHEKARRAEMDFDDLLTQLHDALQGPQGARLAARVRAQFPVALIDEFQDTDPVQYGIFRRIYGPEAGEGGPEALPAALVLIGDPKQAIYAFRGADLHTYLAARRDTDGRHATLDTNFRSSRAMVAAVNQVFGQAEGRPGGEGAFLFRTPAADPLPFVPVQARGRRETWWVDGAAPAALTCWAHDPGGKPLDDTRTRHDMAQACAAEIVRLLRLGQAGRAGFLHGDALRPVQPGDIAVLVNTGTEAATLRKALSGLGVRSVYLSDQQNVFCTDAAGELQGLLHACAEPDDGRRVRAALASGILGLDWEALDRLNHDELHWEERLEQFRHYRDRWQRQGVLPMLRRLLHDFGVPARLIAARNERQLTDLLHLAELLQQASVHAEGEHALVRHLAQQREDASNRAADHRQQRLESDAELLKVVTVHKSKGLEYPLVFVPFACAVRRATADAAPLKWHDEDGRLHLSLAPDDATVARADRERLGEDLRKLYVALTRARHATWLGLATTATLQHSAIGSLLGLAQPCEGGRLAPALVQAFGPCPDIAIEALPAPESQPWVPARPADGPLGELPIARVPRERWWIASYSRLRSAQGPRDAPLTQQPPASADEETWLEEAPRAAATPERGPGQPGTLHAFPSGAADGTLLHALLEWAGRQGFATAAQAAGELKQWLERRCQGARWAPHQDLLARWLVRWLATPLDLGRLDPRAQPVAPVSLTDIQVEMEFWLGLEAVDARALDAAVCRHTLQGAARPPLQPQALGGMLKGFVDLVFAHGGRWWVADYKSNRLGAGDSAYTPDRLRDEVLAHRYELQYSLYLFALHRLLRARLPGYDYDLHVGGAVYLFLRGHAAPGQGLHLEKPPVALMNELDALFDGAGGAS